MLVGGNDNDKLDYNWLNKSQLILAFSETGCMLQERSAHFQKYIHSSVLNEASNNKQWSIAHKRIFSLGAFYVGPIYLWKDKCSMSDWRKPYSMFANICVNKFLMSALASDIILWCL